MENLEGVQRLFTVISFIAAFISKILVGLLIIIIIYANIATRLFSEIKSGEIIDNQINFIDFIHSLLTLIICVTGEQWRIIMYDTYSVGVNTSELFFISFMIICAMITLNLFVLALVE